MSAELRILLSGGGTAGHIAPALAIAAELSRLRPEIKLLYVGLRMASKPTWCPERVSSSRALGSVPCPGGVPLRQHVRLPGLLRPWLFPAT
jgi:hypothetical protein